MPRWVRQVKIFRDLYFFNGSIDELSQAATTRQHKSIFVIAAIMQIFQWLKMSMKLGFTSSELNYLRDKFLEISFRRLFFLWRTLFLDFLTEGIIYRFRINQWHLNDSGLISLVFRSGVIFA